MPETLATFCEDFAPVFKALITVVHVYERYKTVRHQFYQTKVMHI